MKTPHILTPYKHVPFWKPISTNNSVAHFNKTCNCWRERIKKYNNGMSGWHNLRVIHMKEHIMESDRIAQNKLSHLDFKHF